jgi:hypothetical protein
LEGALRIVLVGDRRAEDRQDGIAHELVDEAPMPKGRLSERFKERALERAHLLGIEPLGKGRKAGEVGEKDRDLPAVRLPLEMTGRDDRPGCGQGSRAWRRHRPQIGIPRRPAPGTEREISLAQEIAPGAGIRLPPPASRAEAEAWR